MNSMATKELLIQHFVLDIQQQNGQHETNYAKDWVVIGSLITKFILQIKAQEESLKEPNSTSLSPEATQPFESTILQLLSHEEPRIRMQTADLVLISTQLFPPFNLIQELMQPIFDEILNNYYRIDTVRPTSLGHDAYIQLDDTTGWRSLESYLHAIQQALISLCTANFSTFPYVYTISRPDSTISNSSLLEIVILQSSNHINRYIREMTYNFIYDYFNSLSKDNYHHLLDLYTIQSGASKTLLEWFIETLGSGLEDDWSQVRYAALKALGKIVSVSLYSIGNDLKDYLTQYWPILIPRLCLNRLHAAKSIQTIALSIWQESFGVEGLGRSLLTLYHQEVALFYISMTKVRNHMVCEAACHAISEVCSKLNPKVFECHCYDFLHALEECLKDERWPVRDSACLSSGVIIKTYDIDYPTINRFMNLWKDNFQDCIYSVRENSAIAFGNAIQTPLNASNREKIYEFIMDLLLNHLLDALEEEVVNANEGVKVIKNPNFTFLPKSMLEPKDSLHHLPIIDNPIDGKKPMGDNSKFSRKGWGCCIDCVELRAAQPWELSHGAVFLLRELFLSNYQTVSIITRIYGFKKNNEIISLSLLSALLLLIESTNYNNFEKLHAAIYEEIPNIMTLLQQYPDLQHEKEEFQRKVMELIERDINLVEPEDIVATNSINNKRRKAHSSVELRKQMAITCSERIRDLIPSSSNL